MTGLYQFITGGNDRDAQLFMHWQIRQANSGAKRQIGGGDHAARRKHRRICRHILARAAGIGTGL
jgi:hypothetical protein